MNPLIITAFTIGGAIAGYFLCKLRMAGKAGDMRAEHGEDCTLCEPLRERIAQQEKQIGKLVGLRINVENAHRRCSDALTTKNQRIERALSCVTENSAHVGKKMAAILRGER